MTINGIWDWASGFSKPLTIASLRGKTLAVDGHIWLYESIRGCENHYRSNASLLVTFFKRCQLLLEQNIRLIVVFDCIVSDRLALSVHNKKEFTARKTRRWGDDNRSMQFIDKVLDCQAILKHLGVTVVISTGDGEAQCANLEASGVTQGTITPDFDYFLFGGRNMYRIQFEAASNGIKDVSHLAIASLEFEKRILRTGLISIAILLGCDYFKNGVTGIGIVTGLDILTEFGQASDEEDDPAVILDRFVSYVSGEIPARSEDSERKLKLRRKKYQFPEGFPNSESVHEAIKMYLRPNVIDYRREKIKFEETRPNTDRIINILMEKCGWSEEKVRNEMRISAKRKKVASEKAAQRLITSYCYIKKRRFEPVVEKCSMEEYMESSRKWMESRKIQCPPVNLEKPKMVEKTRPVKRILTTEASWPTYNTSSDDEPNDVIVLDSD